MTSTAHRVACDAGIIAVVGIAFALAANALSPRGLSLRRDYFPGTAAPAAGANPAAPFRIASQADVVAWFHRPHSGPPRLLFVDARDDPAYVAGHIPGAVPFDPYHPERHLATVLVAAQTADRVVVYCHGGSCDDSRSAAQILVAAGIPAERIAIYADGIVGWQQHRLPLETGPASPTP